MSLPPTEPLNVNPAGSERSQKVCSFALERQLRCTADDGSAAPLRHGNKHRSHLKAALIRDAICSLENYKQGHGADMRGHD